MLDERSPVPLYYQLQEIIRSRIDSGEWAPGQQLPPEAELCEEFNLSRGTVRQALADLVREGLLHRRRGKGSFVAQPKFTQNLLSVAGFSRYAKQVFGNELGSRLISVEVVPADVSISKKLEIKEGADVTRVRKVMLADEHPYFLVTTYVAKELCPTLNEDDHATTTVYDLLVDKYNVEITRVKGSFEPVLLNEYEAGLLDADQGSPAMMYERIRFTTGNRPLTVSKHIIRGDMCKLTFQLPESNEEE